MIFQIISSSGTNVIELTRSRSVIDFNREIFPKTPASLGRTSELSLLGTFNDGGRDYGQAPTDHQQRPGCGRSPHHLRFHSPEPGRRSGAVHDVSSQPG